MKKLLPCPVYFSTARLLVAIAVLAASCALITRLAGCGHIYEESAIMYIYVNVDTDLHDEGQLPRSGLTKEVYEKHAGRLLSTPVLERAAALLNRRATEPNLYLGLDSPLAVKGIEKGNRPVIYQPRPPQRTYTSKQLRPHLRTRFARANEPGNENLADDAIIVFATDTSQSEAKSIALSVVEVYCDITPEEASPAADSVYMIKRPLLDSPWKIGGAVALSILVAFLALIAGPHHSGPTRTGNGDADRQRGRTSGLG